MNMDLWIREQIATQDKKAMLSGRAAIVHHR